MTDLTVIIPVYYENVEVVERLYHEVLATGATPLVVDDGDTMKLSISKLTYTPHQGYGYAIKEGIKAAKTDIICTMDGDGQHSIVDVKKIYTTFKLLTQGAMVVGQRWDLKEGPLRRIGRKALNLLASLLANHYLVDLNSGLRVFRRDLAMAYISILCDRFSFTTSLSMSVITDKYKVAYFPIDVMPRTHGSSKVRVIQDGLVTLYYILRIGIAIRTRRLRQWLRPVTNLILRR